MSIEQYEDRVRDRLRKTQGFDPAHMAKIAAEIDLIMAMAHHKGRDADKLADSIAAKYPRAEGGRS